jgi:pimeloyl-ACP methyl ester carboxylesterase
VIDRGSGTPVVLVPGIQGRWEWMAPAVDALAARCRVVTFSLCDEPSSDFACDPERGLDNYLDQIEAAFTRADLRDALVIGVSYGGPVAAEFAARHPGRVRGLVLVSALPLGWHPDERARFYLRAPRLLSPLFCIASPRRMAPELKSAIPALGPRVRWSAGSGLRVVRAFMSPTRMARRIRWIDGYEFTDPRHITAPALIITGEDGLDRVVPPQLTRRYLDALPSARGAVLPGTGHLGYLTKPHLFAEMVEAFAREIGHDARRVSA